MVLAGEQLVVFALTEATDDIIDRITGFLSDQGEIKEGPRHTSMF
jgi:hypothetical protein